MLVADDTSRSSVMSTQPTIGKRAPAGQRIGAAHIDDRYGR